MPRSRKTTWTGPYIGIDPGKHGGIALVYGGKVSRKLPEFWEIPEDAREVWKLVRKLSREQGAVCVIEKVGGFIQGRPAAGSHMFNFGRGYGLLVMALIASGIPFEEVRPQSWQGGLRIPTQTKDETKPEFKDRLRRLAMELYPNLEVWSKTLGEQRAICDALLLATYCKRKETGWLSP